MRLNLTDPQMESDLLELSTQLGASKTETARLVLARALGNELPVVVRWLHSPAPRRAEPVLGTDSATDDGNS